MWKRLVVVIIGGLEGLFWLVLIFGNAVCVVNQRSGDGRRRWSLVFRDRREELSERVVFGRGGGGCESGGRERQMILYCICAVEIWARL